MRIELAPYDDSWPERFVKSAEQLWAVLGDVAERIEHIGPTAVPGLAATLLFGDYLRWSEDARTRYEAVKRELATREWDRGEDYADAKGDCIWQLLRKADRWSWQAGEQE